jgi:hypothetical protein
MNDANRIAHVVPIAYPLYIGPRLVVAIMVMEDEDANGFLERSFLYIDAKGHAHEMADADVTLAPG